MLFKRKYKKYLRHPLKGKNIVKCCNGVMRIDLK
jgi:hypothetical protein